MCMEGGGGSQTPCEPPLDPPMVLVREINMQLLRYSLDTHVSYSAESDKLLDLQVSETLHRGPEFCHYNYLIDYLINYTIGFIIITS